MKELRIQNTLSGKKEVFKAKEPGIVKLYGCGPTVYGYTHVGNARAALTFDLVIRVLTYAGYKVEAARNFTDIDDKIIKVSKDTNTPWQDVTEKYTKSYLSELTTLQTIIPKHMPTATGAIKAMIQMMEGLIAKGAAYESGGDIYFRVSAFKSYGKLSKRKVEDMLEGVRIDPSELKESPADFALWKKAKEGEPSWDSPWSKGRPGWHIECSAMIYDLFKDQLDIHMGGVDLVFPHHENEIAQSEAYTSKSLATYWIHNGLLEMGKEKMSKSLGNIVTTHAFLENYGGEVLRLLFYLQHYRSPLDFSDENVQRAEALLERIYNAKKQSQLVDPVEDSALLRDCESALLDDFNSGKAMGLILQQIRNSFRELTPEAWGKTRFILDWVKNSLHLFYEEPALALEQLHLRRRKRFNLSPEEVEKIEATLIERQAARAKKDFAESDRLRDELLKQGIQVMDSADGVSWTRG